jgi:hypothetical protein
MMTNEQLTAILANCVMGWGVRPNRFLMGNRGWMPRWRFQPTEKLADALRLLEVAAPEEYSLRGDTEGNIRVRVRIGAATGAACSTSKPRAITWAIARAVGIHVADEPQPTVVAKDGTGQKPLRRPHGN